MARYSYFSGGGSGISPLPPNFAQLATAGPAAIAQGMKEASQAIGDALKEKQKASKLKKKEASSSVSFIKGHIAAESDYKSLRGIDIDDLDNMSSDEQIELGAQVMAERQASMDATTQEGQQLAQQGQKLRNTQTQQAMSQALQNNVMGQQTREALTNMMQGYQGPLQEGDSQSMFNMRQALGNSPGADPMSVMRLGTMMQEQARLANAPQAGTVFSHPDVKGGLFMHTGTGAVTTVRGGDRPETSAEQARAYRDRTMGDAYRKALGLPPMGDSTQQGVSTPAAAGDAKEVNLSPAMQKQAAEVRMEITRTKNNLEQIEKLKGKGASWVNFDSGEVHYQSSLDRDAPPSMPETFDILTRDKAKSREEQKLADLEQKLADITGKTSIKDTVKMIRGLRIDDEAGLFDLP